jgi:hypothetical protein
MISGPSAPSLDAHAEEPAAASWHSLPSELRGLVADHLASEDLLRLSAVSRDCLRLARGAMRSLTVRGEKLEQALRCYPRLVDIKLIDATDTHLAAFAGQTRITRIDLSDCTAITETGLAQLAGLKGLIII